MKRKLVVTILILISILLYACTWQGLFSLYPEDISHAWYCEELDITITYLYDENGKFTGIEPLILNWKGETHTLYLGMLGNSYALGTETGRGTLVEQISGTWDYRGDDLVLYIDEDLILGGAFDELVFVPQGSSTEDGFA